MLCRETTIGGDEYQASSSRDGEGGEKDRVPIFGLNVSEIPNSAIVDFRLYIEPVLY